MTITKHNNNYFIPKHLQYLFSAGVVVCESDESMTRLLHKALPLTKNLIIRYI